MFRVVKVLIMIVCVSVGCLASFAEEPAMLSAGISLTEQVPAD